MDKIFIRELALRCIIGIYPVERREKQDIINVEMHCDLRRAGRSDDLNDTVDKPGALRFAESSAVEIVREREGM